MPQNLDLGYVMCDLENDVNEHDKILPIFF